MTKKVYYLIILILVTSSLQCQRQIKNSSSKLQKTFRKAAEEAQLGNYVKAIKYCDDILSKEPDNVDALLRKGSYQNSIKQFDKAESTFQKAIDLNKEKIDARVYYSIALSQYGQEQYADTNQSLEKFLREFEGSSKLKSRASNLLKKSQFIESAINNPVPFNPERLDENINTERLEYLPYITADGSKMVYLSKVNDAEELYYSDITDGHYSQGKLFEDFNYPTGEGAHCISADGKTIIFTSCDYSNSPQRTSYGGCDLYVSKYIDNKWSFPRNLGPEINTRYWESQPSLSGDGKTLYFSSKRRGGIGEADLYISKMSKQGKWLKPDNLGDVINTVGDDESPFLHPDGQTLYFRSNGRPGMGDFDIFFCKWDEEKEVWGKPKNIGYPINTKANDGALFVNLSGTKAYYTSDRYSLENNIKPNLDIYSFELYPEARPRPTTYVKGSVINGITNKAISAKIELKGEDYSQQIETDENGKFVIALPAYRDYSFYVSKENFVHSSDRFELKEIKGAVDPFLLEIVLWPIPKKQQSNSEPMVYNQAIALKNILFESGSSILLKSSFEEIDKLFEMLRDNDQLKIQINGHTDNVGSEQDNLKLSNERAKAVRDELIKKGINSSRVSFRGYGETVSIGDNDTEEGRRINRRTEFVLIK